MIDSILSGEKVWTSTVWRSWVIGYVWLNEEKVLCTKQDSMK